MLTLTGVAGWPVRHSRSPAMFAAAFDATGLAGWRYLALPIAPERLAETVRALPGSGYRGLNVTIPHKEAALALADSATPRARAIGAANSLTADSAGGLEADNTDAPGLLAAIGEPVAGARCLVLGAGGSARAAAWALREAGAEVALWNRTAARAAAVAAELGIEHVPEPEPCEVLVNCTAAGLTGTGADLPLARVGRPGVVVDLVYGDGPPVTAWARAEGLRLVDGTEVLVQQGALSFERWTGIAAPVENMREAAREPRERYTLPDTLA